MSRLIERNNLESLYKKANEKIEWLYNNVWHKDFLHEANEYAILTKKINDFYKNNKCK